MMYGRSNKLRHNPMKSKTFQCLTSCAITIICLPLWKNSYDDAQRLYRYYFGTDLLGVWSGTILRCSPLYRLCLYQPSRKKVAYHKVTPQYEDSLPWSWFDSLQSSRSPKERAQKTWGHSIRHPRIAIHLVWEILTQSHPKGFHTSYIRIVASQQPRLGAYVLHIRNSLLILGRVHRPRLYHPFLSTSNRIDCIHKGNNLMHKALTLSSLTSAVKPKGTPLRVFRWKS